MINTKFISHKFKFDDLFKQMLNSKLSPLDLIGNIVFKNTYALNPTESWADCCIRCIEGSMSIIKTHCFNNRLYYDQDVWNHIGMKMVNSMFEMKWSPAGRHLANMGTRKIERYGGLSLNNCMAITTQESISESALLMFNFLRDQAGVGFDTEWNGKLTKPKNTIKLLDTSPEDIIYQILSSYENGTPYPLLPDKGIGNNLKWLYNFLTNACDNFLYSGDRVRFIVDVMNSIGKYVAGKYNRRSAQIALHNINDNNASNITFLNLKSKDILKERSEISWASNNSIVLTNTEDFHKFIPLISDGIRENGEPGIINGYNLQKYGRMYRKTESIRLDDHKINLDMGENTLLVNPCGEQTLEPM
jgi:hypothetical protein